MIYYGYFYRNVNTEKNLSLLDEWYAEDCTDVPLTLHMREYYALKYQKHGLDTTLYMESLPGEYSDKYSKVIDDEMHILIRTDTQEVVLRNLVAGNNVLPGTCFFKCKRKSD